MIERISILGTGLIGASLGLAWRQASSNPTVVGYDQDDEALEVARRQGALDETAPDPAAAVRDADLVVLATPLPVILRLMEEIASSLPADAIVTDVGSVKHAVVEHARETLPAETLFIGGHPMAGAETSGARHADPLLFQNATYVLCPPEGTSASAFQDEQQPFLDLIQATGANVRLLGAARHDRLAAAVSHLPQLLAVGLTNTVGAVHEHDDAALQLAAGGFRDMTRIASSPFSMWRAILAANHGAVLDMLGQFASTLRRLRNRLAEESWEALEEAFTKARRTRTQIPRSTQGFLAPTADLYVRAEDRPGELHRLTGVLYEAELNVKDIELLSARSDTGGVFRIGLNNPESAEAAQDALEQAGFPAHPLENG